MTSLLILAICGELKSELDIGQVSDLCDPSRAAHARALLDHLTSSELLPVVRYVEHDVMPTAPAGSPLAEYVAGIARPKRVQLPVLSAVSLLAVRPQLTKAGLWGEGVAAWVDHHCREEKTSDAHDDYVLTSELTRPGTGIYEQYTRKNSEGRGGRSARLASLLKKDWMAAAKSDNGRHVSVGRAKALFTEHGYAPVVPHDPSSLLSGGVVPFRAERHSIKK